MPETIPVSAARGIAEAFRCRQVIVLAWDGERTHVVTYGENEHDSDQAAEGGNFLKRALGWPARFCKAESPRVRALQDRIFELEAELGRTVEIPQGDLPPELRRDVITG